MLSSERGQKKSPLIANSEHTPEGNMQKEKDTASVLQSLKNVTTLSDGLNAISENYNSFVEMSFSQFFTQYLADHQDLKLANIIKDSGVTRQYAHDVIKGVKSASRDRIIALCFAAGMDLDETNHALIFAKHTALYARNPRDAVVIVAIRSKMSGSKACLTATDLSILLDEQEHEPLDI